MYGGFIFPLGVMLVINTVLYYYIFAVIRAENHMRKDAVLGVGLSKVQPHTLLFQELTFAAIFFL